MNYKHIIDAMQIGPSDATSKQSLIEKTSIQMKLEHCIVTKIRVLGFILIAMLVLKYLKTLVWHALSV